MPAVATIPDARSFVQYLRRYLPGEPTIVVQNMPGAGGLLATNWLANVAPRDGLTIGFSQRGVPFYPYFGDKNAAFDPTAMNWLGSFNSETGVLITWKTSSVKTMSDAVARESIFGGSGPNDSVTYPALMNRTIGTKFKIVSGYKASTDVLLAMERGEVEGLSGSWSSLKAERRSGSATSKSTFWFKLPRRNTQISRRRAADHGFCENR